MNTTDLRGLIDDAISRGLVTVVPVGVVSRQKKKKDDPEPTVLPTNSHGQSRPSLSIYDGDWS